MGFNMTKLKTAALRITKYILPLVGLVPVAFGISFALGKMAPEKAQAALEVTRVIRSNVTSDTAAARVALIIGNSDYPDANQPLRHPAKDAQALADQLRRNGFEVDVQENLGKDEMKQAFDSFRARIRPGTVAFVAFSGFGIQVDRQSYMVPVNAQIWKEADVRRDGISIDQVLADMHRSGAVVKLAVIDASRRNPFERRFRGVSTGLAAIDAPPGTLLMSAAAPGKVMYDTEGDNSLLIGELLKEINSPGVSAEAVFNHTRIGVSRASNGEQVPQVSSSLIENFAFVPGSSRYARPRPAPFEEAPRVAARTDYVDPPVTQPNDAIDMPSNLAPPQPVEVAPVTPVVPVKPVEKPAAVEKPAQTEQAARPVERKPVVERKPTVEKHVPTAKEIRAARAQEERAARAQEESRRPRRTVRDMYRDHDEEQQVNFIRRGGWFSDGPRFRPGWGMGGGFGRWGHGGRSMLGMGF
jgi:caspase domain-containing protein